MILRPPFCLSGSAPPAKSEPEERAARWRLCVKGARSLCGNEPPSHVVPAGRIRLACCYSRSACWPGAHRLSWSYVLLSSSGGQCGSDPGAAGPARAGEPGPALPHAWGQCLADHQKRREAPAFMPGMDRRWARRAQCPRAQQDPRSTRALNGRGHCIEGSPGIHAGEDVPPTIPAAQARQASERRPHGRPVMRRLGKSVGMGLLAIGVTGMPLWGMGALSERATPNAPARGAGRDMRAGHSGGVAEPVTPAAARSWAVCWCGR